MAKTKYIVGKIKAKYFDVMGGIVFPETVEHDMFKHNFVTIVGAGFCFVSAENKVEVYGKSISLGVESRPEDAAILERTYLINDVD